MIKWTPEQIPVTDSTNLLLKERAQKGAKEGLAILAYRQTAGRGRLGRSFFSPDGTGLYLSFLLRPRLPAEACTRLTALAALAVCRALQQRGFSPAVKWVNDVYLKGKKLCGILTQAGSVGQSGSPDWVVVGIGMNILPPEGGFPEELCSLATALYESHPDPAQLREQLSREILEEFALLYEKPLDPAAVEEYQGLCFLPGKQVLVSEGENRYPATVQRVNDDLSLLILTEDGKERSLCSGEVSLKLQ